MVMSMLFVVTAAAWLSIIAAGASSGERESGTSSDNEQHHLASACANLGMHMPGMARMMGGRGGQAPNLENHKGSWQLLSVSMRLIPIPSGSAPGRVATCTLLCLLVVMQGIKEHPWYTAELPPFLQQGLDDMAAEQVIPLPFQRLELGCWLLSANWGRVSGHQLLCGHHHGQPAELTDSKAAVCLTLSFGAMLELSTSYTVG